MPQNADPWLVLSLHDGGDVLHLDARGNDPALEPIAFRGSERVQTEIEVDGAPRLLSWPIDLTLWLDNMFEHLGEEDGVHATGPLALPVFVRTTGNDLHPRWPDAIRRWLVNELGVDPQRVVVGMSPYRRWIERQPFEFPLKVLTCGRSSNVVAEHIRGAGWFSENVSRHGIEIDEIQPEDGTAVFGQWPACDIIVCDAEHVDIGLTFTARERRSRARLIIVVGDVENLEISEKVAALGPGASMLVMDAPRLLGSGFARHFIEGIIHDRLLHQAVRAAQRLSGFDLLDTPVDFYTDPAANQNLRMRAAGLALFERALNVADYFDFGDVSAIGPVLSEIPQAIDISTALNTVRNWGSQVTNAARFLEFNSADFGQESIGLEPRAYGLARLEETQPERAQALDLLAETVNAPEMREALLEVQDRRVNIRVLDRDPAPYENYLVSSDDTLKRGGRYRIHVHIGRLAADSIVTGDIPSIDAVLPDPQSETGHLLSVVIAGLDFKTSGRTVKTLTLPHVGPSDSVSFDVQAPESEGPARLRVLVYYETELDATTRRKPEIYHNHLVQSFVLHTNVTAVRDYQPDVTRATLEFTRTQRFANLPTLERRAISLAFNDDPGGDGHSVSVKSGTTACELHINEAQMGAALDSIRTTLKNASFDDPGGLTGPRFVEGERDSDRWPLFESVIRELALKGYDFWQEFFINRALKKAPVMEMYRALNSASDIPVQIVPLDGYLFPWAAIYTFLRPDNDAEVCDGFRRRNAAGETLSCQDCLADCLHPDKSEAFCVYGFWGTRFRIEHLLDNGQRDAVNQIRPIRSGAVQISVGLKGGPALALPETLAQLVDPSFIRNLGPQDELIDLLWDDTARPAVLLIVGHCEPELDQQGNPSGPKITLPGVDRWLRPYDVTNKFATEALRGLADPSPIVVLAACDSAGSTLETFGDFIKSFSGAGAAAIVGFETSIIQQLASRVSERLATGLLREQPLSEAVLDLRRELIRENNPLGFLITAFGDAALKHEHPDSPGEIRP